MFLARNQFSVVIDFTVMAGALVTTASDMGKFIIGLLGDSPASTPFLTSAARSRLFERHFSAHPSMPGIAYGFFEGSANGYRTLHHTGDRGHHSLLWLVPESNVGLFFVYTTPSKCDSSLPRSQLAAKITDLLFPSLPAEPMFTQTDSASRIQRVLGIYRPNQTARTTIEKLAAIPSQIRVSSQNEGSIGISLGLVASPERFVEAEPFFFMSAEGVLVAF